MRAVVDLLDHALADGVGTAVQFCVQHPEGRFGVARGHRSPGGARIDEDTPFDLASVTKLVTTLLVADAVAQGKLRFDEPIGTWLPTAAAPAITVRELLGHRSGLVAWRPWFDGVDADGLRARVLAEVPETPGVRRYSDAGFLLLGWLLEAVHDLPLDAIARAWMSHLPLRYARRADPCTDAVVTGVWRPREPAPGQEGAYRVPPQVPRLAPGQVDDDNAWALDGVAGHAGLFGPAHALVALGSSLLDDLGGAQRRLPRAVVAELVAIDAPELAPVRSLGFDRAAAEGSSLGTRLGRGPHGAIGHLGFTGTSLWIDLDHRVVVALCTNRTFPLRADTDRIRALRPAVHDAVAEALGIG